MIADIGRWEANSVGVGRGSKGERLFWQDH